MNVKKPGWIATVAAGVVLVGGGAWAATAIASDEPEPVAVETPTSTPTPEATATPEATPTPTPEVAETPHYTGAESAYLAAAQQSLAGWSISVSDDELLAAGTFVCNALAEGAEPLDIQPIPDLGSQPNGDIYYAADDHLC